MSPVPPSILGTGAAVGPPNSCPTAQLASAKPDGTDPEDRTTAEMLDCAQTDRQTAPGTGRCDGERRGRGSLEPDGFYQAQDLPIQGGKSESCSREDRRLLTPAGSGVLSCP